MPHSFCCRRDSLTAEHLRAYRGCNPRFFQRLCSGCANANKCSRSCGHPEASFPSKGGSVNSPENGASAFECRPHHVFPVYDEVVKEGFIVPLEIGSSTSGMWSISDAFGRLGGHNPKDDPLVGFMELLRCMEDAAFKVFRASPPLRWRRFFALRLLCPVHMDVFDGTSHLVPLAVAALRALVTPLGKELPFGNRPVFSTGRLSLSSGKFDTVDFVKEKLEAFVREYGSGLPAILTDLQEKALPKKLRGRVQVVGNISSLESLVRVREFKEALKRFIDDKPRESELDVLIERVEKLHRCKRHEDAEKCARWVRNFIRKKPVYEFKLDQNIVLLAAHRGDFDEERKRFRDIRLLLKRHPECFGVNERIVAAATEATFAFDACQPELVLPVFEGVRPFLDQASPDERARFWGAYCQVLCAAGDLDGAVNAGEEAVRWADTGAMTNSRMDRSHLIHALLSRARQCPGSCRMDLAKAQRRISELQNRWSEPDDLFCLHLQAELARIQGRPFSQKPRIKAGQPWQHPVLFVLQANARNEKNSPEVRYEMLSALRDDSERLCLDTQERDQAKLFCLFRSIYQTLAAHIRGDNLRGPLSEVEKCCTDYAQMRLPGWKRRLSPIIHSIHRGNDPAGVERLCAAIPHH